LAAFTGPCAIGPASRAGIGTEHPHSPLEVKGQIGTSNTNSVTITNTGTAGAAGRGGRRFQYLRALQQRHLQSVRPLHGRG
jgi:phage-related minor tail protein